MPNSMALDMSMDASVGVFSGAFSGTTGQHSRSNAVHGPASPVGSSGSAAMSGSAFGSSNCTVLPPAVSGSSVFGASSYSPAQAITVDGLVSPFTPANGVPQSGVFYQPGLSVPG